MLSLNIFLLFKYFQVINFLLTTEIIPLCLRIMESGSQLNKTVATFIIKKILLDETGLYYICQTYDRFSHVAMILGKMVIQLSKEPSQRVLKHVVRCYLRLSDNTRAREALCQCFPDQLKDDTFATCLKDDKSTKHWLAHLLKNIEEKTTGTGTGGGAGGGHGGRVAPLGREGRHKFLLVAVHQRNCDMYLSAKTHAVCLNSRMGPSSLKILARRAVWRLPREARKELPITLQDFVNK